MAQKYSSILCILAAVVTLSACSGESSTQVQAMQRKDKQLSCKEVLLEMNEAQFYKKMALKNKDPKLKTVLMPLGYISTYMGAEEAAGTATARIEYLDKIYDIMDCDAANSAPAYQQPVNSYQQRNAPPAYVGATYAPPPAAYRKPQEAPVTYYQDENEARQQQGVSTLDNGKRYW